MIDKELLRIYNSYVPYGFTGKIKSSNEIMFVNYIYFKDYDNDPFKSEFPIQGSGIGGIMSGSVNTFKPILYSIDMMIKEIDYEGETFVPIEKLAEMAGFSLNKDYKKIIGEDLICVGYSDYDSYNHFIYTFAGRNFHFEIGDNFSGQLPRCISNNFELINKMIEWGFNVYSLPETAYIKKEEITTEQFKKGKLL